MIISILIEKDLTIPTYGKRSYLTKHRIWSMPLHNYLSDKFHLKQDLVIQRYRLEENYLTFNSYVYKSRWTTFEFFIAIYWMIYLRLIMCLKLWKPYSPFEPTFDFGVLIFYFWLKCWIWFATPFGFNNDVETFWFIGIFRFVSVIPQYYWYFVLLNNFWNHVKFTTVNLQINWYFNLCRILNLLNLCWSILMF